MYTLVRSRYRSDRRSGRWIETDLTHEPITSLTARYGDVMFYITYSGLNGVKALSIRSITNLLQGVNANTTVQGWLTQMGNTTLPWETELPNEEVRLVEYTQAWHSGYDIQTCSREGNPDANSSSYVQEDLIITHPEFEPQYIDDHCLFTVNGFVHLSDYSTENVRIVDGNTTIRKANDNQVGIISFEKIGKIKKVPIKKEMVFRQNPEAKLHEGVYVTIPDTVDLTDKSVLLVLGGYLQTLGKTYTQVSDRTWRIEIGNILFLERYFESNKYLDLSAMELKEDDSNANIFSVSKMLADETINAYLTLSQTFFVIVDAKTMFYEVEPLEYSKFPGRYLSQLRKPYPLMGANGRIMDYHIIEENGYFVYCARPNNQYNYVARTTNWKNEPFVDDALEPNNPMNPSIANLRILGTES